MHQNHATFESAIRGRKKVRVTFYNPKTKTQLTHLCAPVDFALVPNAEDKAKRYQLWDHDSQQLLSLVTSQVRRIEATDEPFDPAEVVTWSHGRWTIKRDWGTQS